MANKNTPPPSDNRSKGRRPAATLDLKATEVTDKKADTADKAKSDPKTKTDSKKTRPQASAKTTTPLKSETTASESKKPTLDSRLRAGAPQPEKPINPTGQKPTTNKTHDGGGIFSGHLFSGLAGGALALLGTLVIQNLPPASTDDNTALGSTSQPPQIISRIDALEQRLNSLPKNATENIQPSETAISSDALDKPGKLAGLETELQNLVIENAELRARTSTIEKRQEQFKKQDIPEEITARLRRFEETISALASTTQNPGQSNAGEIASLIGQINNFESMLDTKIAKVATDTQNLRQKLNAASTNSQSLSNQLKTLKSDIEAREQSLAKTELVKTEIAALSNKLTTLTNNLTTMSGKIDELDQHEKQQRQNAGNVLLSLELTDLKHAIDQGRPYANQLAQIKQLAGNTLGLAALDRFKDQKVLSTIELQQSFRNLAHKILTEMTEGENATMFSKIMANAKGVIRIRKTGEVNGNDTEAILARMESKLKTGNLSAVLTEAKSLPARSRLKAKSWLGQIEARSTIDRSLAALQSRFKSSLAPITSGDAQ